MNTSLTSLVFSSPRKLRSSSLFLIILMVTIHTTLQQIPNCASQTALTTIYFVIIPNSGSSSSNVKSCITCSPGFNHYLHVVLFDVLNRTTFDLYRCNNCSGTCKTCNADPNSCITCAHSYYLQGTSCLSCSKPNCAICTITSCLTCVSPYTLDAFNFCQLNCVNIYGPACDTCDTSNCLTCTTNNVLNQQTPSRCTSCNTLTQCQTCGNGPICNVCNENFYLDFANSSLSCVSCSFANCVKCIDGPVCSICTTGFALDFNLTPPICVACSLISNCLNCRNGPQCIQCTVNLVPNDTMAWNQCVPCGPRQYSLKKKCLQCPDYCTACQEPITGGVVCTSCQPGSVINPENNLCKKCDTVMNMCSLCSDLSTCTQCQYPHLLTNSSLCDQCQSGFTLLQGFCTNITGCQSFSPDYSKCLVCFTIYHFQYKPKTSKCGCIEGHYLQNLSGFHQCVSKCGDGIFVSDDEDCDDGNLRNQDGCSDQCQQETGFSCTSQSPSQCTLQYTPSEFYFNYAYRYEGENRCKFSLYLTPSHPSFKYVDWSKYLSLNMTDETIVKNSKMFRYFEAEKELSIEFEYKSHIQKLKVEIKLFQDQQNGLIVQQSGIEVSSDVKNTNLSPNQISRVVTQNKVSAFSNLNISNQVSLVFDIKGANSKLIYEDQSILKAYQKATTVSLIITVLILIQFVIGSYFHKMIGLETIHILQFFYFVRIIIEQNFSTFLNSMNVFKYVAYGGFSDYQSIYGQQSTQSESLTYMTVKENFVQVGLMKYFSTNVNVSLTVPAMVLTVFLFLMSRKYSKRGQYLKSLDMSIKDQYTRLRRSSQWMYDHFVFPYLSIFSMLIFFSTVLYLQSSQGIVNEFEGLSVIKIIETTSFSAHLAMAFLTFLIFCSEVFTSFEEFQYSRLTEKEKSRVPVSIYQKLEHDQNNPDRPNYKPVYVLVYLTFYLLVEIVLMLDVLLPSLEDFGLYIMMTLSLAYLILVWKWKPYHKVVEFHNKILILNHLVVFLFMVMSVVSQRFQINIILYVTLIYLFLLLLAILALCGYMRIVFQYRFRKKLSQNSDFMENFKRRIGSKEDQNQSSLVRKEAMLRNNQYAFQNIMRQWIFTHENVQQSNLTELTQEQVIRVKEEIRKEIYTANREKTGKEVNDFLADMLVGQQIGNKQSKQTQLKTKEKYQQQVQEQIIKSKLPKKTVPKVSTTNQILPHSSGKQKKQQIKSERLLNEVKK